jgi:hypothetical protein
VKELSWSSLIAVGFLSDLDRLRARDDQLNKRLKFKESYFGAGLNIFVEFKLSASLLRRRSI